MLSQGSDKKISFVAIKRTQGVQRDKTGQVVTLIQSIPNQFFPLIRNDGSHNEASTDWKKNQQGDEYQSKFLLGFMVIFQNKSLPIVGLLVTLIIFLSKNTFHPG